MKTLEEMKQEYAQMAAQAGEKAFVREVLKVEIQDLQKRMYECQKAVIEASKPVEPAPTA